MTRKTHSRPRHAGQGTLRIIGGTFRGRKLHFPVVDGVRPSPDRVRETLFNWLMPALPEAYCLDLFSGSGAFSLEALSRGAAAVTAVDLSAPLTRQLADSARALNIQARLSVVRADVTVWLNQKPPSPFDIVFMDPPFNQGWLEVLLPILARPEWLRPGAWIYIEHEAGLTPRLPKNWMIHRQKRAGQVCSTLCRASPD